MTVLSTASHCRAAIMKTSIAAVSENSAAEIKLEIET